MLASLTDTMYTKVKKSQKFMCKIWNYQCLLASDINLGQCVGEFFSIFGNISNSETAYVHFLLNAVIY